MGEEVWDPGGGGEVKKGEEQQEEEVEIIRLLWPKFGLKMLSTEKGRHRLTDLTLWWIGFGAKG